MVRPRTERAQERNLSGSFARLRLAAWIRCVRQLVEQDCDAITGGAKLGTDRAGAHRCAMVMTAVDSLPQHFGKAAQIWRCIVDDEGGPMIPRIAVVENTGSPRVRGIVEYAQSARLQLFLNQFFLFLQR